MRHLRLLLLFFGSALALILISFAHPGGTDANGGHRDSSTGEYHYHHGYPAHQHTNGICPYKSDDKTGSVSGTSGTSKTNATSGTTRSSPSAAEPVAPSAAPSPAEPPYLEYGASAVGGAAISGLFASRKRRRIQTAAIASEKHLLSQIGDVQADQRRLLDKIDSLRTDLSAAEEKTRKAEQQLFICRNTIAHLRAAEFASPVKPSPADPVLTSFADSPPPEEYISSILNDSRN